MGAPTTGLYAALYLILIIGLSLRVVLLRRRLRVGIGDGGHVELAQAIRVHANALEVPPLVLLLMLLAELGGAAPIAMYIAGAALLVGRALHVVGLSRHRGTSFGRFWGTGLTWLTGLAMMGLLFGQWYSG